MTKKQPIKDDEPKPVPVKNPDGSFKTDKYGLVEFTMQDHVTHTR